MKKKISLSSRLRYSAVVLKLRFLHWNCLILYKIINIIVISEFIYFSGFKVVKTIIGKSNNFKTLKENIMLDDT